MDETKISFNGLKNVYLQTSGNDGNFFVHFLFHNEVMNIIKSKLTY